MKEPIFEYDISAGIASCTLYDKHNEYTGYAFCHPDDKDFESEKVGCEIALHRAKISYLKGIRNNEIKPSLAALKQLYYNMKHSKKFNEKSYENKMLQRHIHSLENDLATIKEMIVTEEQELKNYLEIKEELHKTLRRLRKMDKNN